jgi:hypothetical protein
MALFLLENKDFFNYDNMVEITKNIYLEYYEIFRKRVTPILELEQYDKIGIINCEKDKDLQLDFHLYIDKASLYQPLLRWYYNQQRIIVFEKLDILFEKYNSTLKQIQEICEKNREKLLFIYEKYLELNILLINKLTILKETYNDNNINYKIDKYLIFLSNFTI